MKSGTQGFGIVYYKMQNHISETKNEDPESWDRDPESKDRDPESKDQSVWSRIQEPVSKIQKPVSRINPIRYQKNLWIIELHEGKTPLTPWWPVENGSVRFLPAETFYIFCTIGVSFCVGK